MTTAAISGAAIADAEVITTGATSASSSSSLLSKTDPPSFLEAPPRKRWPWLPSGAAISTRPWCWVPLVFECTTADQLVTSSRISSSSAVIGWRAPGVGDPRGAVARLAGGFPHRHRQLLPEPVPLREKRGARAEQVHHESEQDTQRHLQAFTTPGPVIPSMPTPASAGAAQGATTAAISDGAIVSAEVITTAAAITSSSSALLAKTDPPSFSGAAPRRRGPWPGPGATISTRP